MDRDVSRPRRRVAGDRRPKPDPDATPLAAPRTRRWSKKAIRWVGAVVAAAVLGLATAFGGVFGTTAATGISRSQPAAITGLPAKLDSVQIVPDGNDTNASADQLPLTTGQLAQLNSLLENPSGYQNWLDGHSVVAAHSIDIQIVVEGNRDEKVRVVGMQPVVDCSAPLHGTLYFSPSSGLDLSTQLFVNLDAPAAPLAYQNGDGTRGTNFFEAYTVSLAQGEQYTFNVIASTALHYCTFTLDMSVLDGDKTVAEDISDNGQPFRESAMIPTTPGSPKYNVVYDGGIANSKGGNIWARANPDTYQYGIG